MEHKISNNELTTDLIIDETSGGNTCITIVDGRKILYHYLTPEKLHSFIGTLLHVQAKKRNELEERRKRYSIKKNS